MPSNLKKGKGKGGKGLGKGKVKVSKTKGIAGASPKGITASTRQRYPRKVKAVRLTWRGTDLPADTRVSVMVSSSKTVPGNVVKSGVRLGARGTTVKISALARGANYVTLVPKSKGITFDAVRYAKPVWKR